MKPDDRERIWRYVLKCGHTYDNTVPNIEKGTLVRHPADTDRNPACRALIAVRRRLPRSVGLVKA